MSQLPELRPQIRHRVIDLVASAGMDVSDWGNFKGGPAKASVNPKYCYEWSFVQGEIIVLCLWFENMRFENEVISQHINMRKRAPELARMPNDIIWKSRASKTDGAIQMAYELQLPLRIIICDGRRRNANNLKASSVKKRELDPVPWAVISYNRGSGDCILKRGAKPIEPTKATEVEDDVLEGFDGEEKRLFVLHRKREARFRNLKIQESLHKNSGRLLCEVPNCGFDFAAMYGKLGVGYAQVHHKMPLSKAPKTGSKIVLDDLAVVCANCHVMIHRGGECRPLKSLIPKQGQLRRG